MVTDSNSIKINNFTISNGNNYFSIGGVVSEDKNDTLYLRLNGININALNNLYESRTSDDPGKIHLALVENWEAQSVLPMFTGISCSKQIYVLRILLFWRAITEL
jgi:hypothetical protein